ncbi:hypothetical protein P1J78_14090 [Psychromarinibacter sp. C21-152]|uniref:Uncharacterized protein n=1 Tax=Psychromarinibacter sediminicola TaxID=3033385 RepID=A0AAE3NTP3_9RHOB|nr:hypothetical protein [Psychromarinibacter sediminicola]MDF0601872.1 hypothetical protein [Psychromarinibacter sediminicola]
MTKSSTTEACAGAAPAASGGRAPKDADALDLPDLPYPADPRDVGLWLSRLALRLRAAGRS